MRGLSRFQELLLDTICAKTYNLQQNVESKYCISSTQISRYQTNFPNPLSEFSGSLMPELFRGYHANSDININTGEFRISVLSNATKTEGASLRYEILRFRVCLHRNKLEKCYKKLSEIKRIHQYGLGRMRNIQVLNMPEMPKMTHQHEREWSPRQP